MSRLLGKLRIVHTVDVDEDFLAWARHDLDDGLTREDLEKVLRAQIEDRIEDLVRQGKRIRIVQLRQDLEQQIAALEEETRVPTLAEVRTGLAPAPSPRIFPATSTADEELVSPGGTA